MGPDTMYIGCVGAGQETKWKLTESSELDFSALAYHAISRILHMLLQHKYTHLG